MLRVYSVRGLSVFIPLTAVAGTAFLTNKVIFCGPFWNFIINFVIFIEMELLERVEYEIPKVLIHVDSQNAAIEAVDGTPAIHDLEMRDSSVTALASGGASNKRHQKVQSTLGFCSGSVG